MRWRRADWRSRPFLRSDDAEMLRPCQACLLRQPFPFFEKTIFYEFMLIPVPKVKSYPHPT